MATATQKDYAEQIRTNAKEAFGFVPNLITEITEENPAVADAYMTASGLLEEGGVLTEAEQQAVFLAISSHNDCHYCKAAHVAEGQKAGLDTETVEAIHEGGLPGDNRLKHLVQATRRILNKRGWLTEEDEEEFADLGLGRPALYEVIALAGIKTITNYVNHVAGTEIDEPLQ